MELRVQQARAIVHEINTVLPQKINLMNKDGIIIASTDPERIHTFHGGAARVIRETSTSCASIGKTSTPAHGRARISCCR